MAKLDSIYKIKCQNLISELEILRMADLVISQFLDQEA